MLVFLFSADRSNDCISSNDPSCITRCLRRDNMQGQCVCPPGMALHNDNESCIGNCLFSFNPCFSFKGWNILRKLHMRTGEKHRAATVICPTFVKLPK
jgi:hypothetical protein